MKEQVKKNLYFGMFTNYLLFNMTTPLINIFFIQQVSTMVFSVVNWTSIVLTLLMSKVLKNKNNRDVLEKFFLQIIVIDTILFIIVSFAGEYCVDIRFFGLAVLNGTTTAIWMCIMRSNINKVFIGEELTDLETHQDYLTSIAQLIGATLAILFTKLSVNINILMFMQIIASITMGFFDYKTIKIINNEDVKVRKLK